MVSLRFNVGEKVWCNGYLGEVNGVRNNEQRYVKLESGEVVEDIYYLMESEKIQHNGIVYKIITSITPEEHEKIGHKNIATLMRNNNSKRHLTVKGPRGAYYFVLEDKNGNFHFRRTNEVNYEN